MPPHPYALTSLIISQLFLDFLFWLFKQEGRRLVSLACISPHVPRGQDYHRKKLWFSSEGTLDCHQGKPSVLERSDCPSTAVLCWHWSWRWAQGIKFIKLHLWHADILWEVTDDSAHPGLRSQSWQDWRRSTGGGVRCEDLPQVGEVCVECVRCEEELWVKCLVTCEVSYED